VLTVCVVDGDETRCLLRRDLSSLLLASCLRPSSTRDTLWAVYLLKCHVTLHWNREPSSLCVTVRQSVRPMFADFEVPVRILFACCRHVLRSTTFSHSHGLSVCHQRTPQSTHV